MSHITLVRPPMIVVREVPSRSCVPPIGLAYLAASLIASGHDVKAIDAVGESIFQVYPVNGGKHFAHGLKLDNVVDLIPMETDFIGVSCMFSHEWPITRDVIQMIRHRFPKTPIIVGGEHATATAEITLTMTPEIDYLVLGEGELIFPRLIAALACNESVSGMESVLSHENSKRPTLDRGPVDRALHDTRIQDVDEIPTPAWDLFPLKSYLDNGFGHGVQGRRSLPFLATRGCPYQCTFCSSPQMWTTRYVTRQPSSVTEEMEGYIRTYNVRNFGFCDLTTVIRKDWIVDFCKQVIDRKLDITFQFPNGTRSEAIDGEVSHLLYRAGCRTIYYAPESGSPTVLKRIKKAVRLDSMKLSMKQTIGEGIIVKANMIIGFPGETHREVWQTLKFLAQMAWLGVHDVTITGFIPYPGSELFNELLVSRKIEHYDDEYLWSLSTTSNAQRTISSSEHITSAALHRYKMFGLCFFYAVSYLHRPWRFLRILYNIATGRPDESRMESALRTLFRKAFFSRRPPQIVTVPPKAR